MADRQAKRGPCRKSFELLVLTFAVATMLVLSLGGIDLPAASAGGASQLSGVVEDAAGNPLPGLSVELSGGYSTTTASDGSFSFIVDSGQYTLYINRDDDSGSTAESISVPLDLSTSLNQVFTLPALAPVSVVVTDTFDSSVVGASVYVGPSTLGCSTTFDVATGLSATDSFYIETRSGLSLTTDATGTASFDALPCSAMTYSADASFGTAVASVPSFSVTGPTTIPITLYLPGQDVTFSGVVVDTAGDPLSGVNIAVYGRGPLSRASTTSDSNGDFSLSVQAGTDYEIGVTGTSPDGIETYTLSASDMNFTSSLTDQTVSLPISPLTIAVSDSNDNPIEGVAVSMLSEVCPVPSFQLLPSISTQGGSFTVSGSTQQTDSNGDVSFDSLPCNGSGEFHIQPPSGEGLAEQYITVPNWSGPTTIPVVVASLQGTLVDAENQPLPSQTVQIQASGGSSVQQGVTSQSGAFALTVPPGDYSVTLSGSLGDPTSYEATVPNVNLTSGQSGDIALPTELVTVEATDPSGAGVAGATVTMSCTSTSFPMLSGQASGTECATENTDSSGSATLELLPTASVTVSVSPVAGSGLASASETFVPEIGQSVVVSLPAVQAPAITSANSTAMTVGESGSFQVSATGTPAPVLSEVGSLPSGVTFSAAGLFSGSPATGTGGSYPITITASNGVSPNATQAYTLTVRQAPAITSANSTSFTIGAVDSFQVAATGFPAPAFSETGALPKGITFSSSGLLWGTPATASGGTYAINVTGSNGVSPNATQAITLLVGRPPAITSGASATATVAKSFSFQITATGLPAPTFTETGPLPAGITLSGAGQLSGTPVTGAGGTYSMTFTASNGVSPNATQAFTLTVRQAPAITSANSTTFTVASSGNFHITASGFPAPTFTETGALPAGVTLSSAGQLSGTPAAGTGGSYSFTITATNTVSSFKQSFVLTLKSH